MLKSSGPALIFFIIIEKKANTTNGSIAKLKNKNNPAKKPILEPS